MIYHSEQEQLGDVWWSVKVKWFNFPVWKLVPLQRIQSRLSSPYHSKFQIGKSQSTKLFRHIFCLFIHLSSTFENGAGRPVKLSHKYSGALQNISFFPLLHKSDWDWKMYKICNKYLGEVIFLKNWTSNCCKFFVNSLLLINTGQILFGWMLH